MKPKFSRYNDGIVSIYRAKDDKKSNFGAKENVSGLSDMVFVVKLAFEQASKREQDFTFAEQNDFTLSLKVKTRLFETVDNKCKAVIDGYLYTVSYCDKTRTEMFLYLEGIKPLEVSE